MRVIEKVWFYQHSAKWLLVPLLLPFTALFWLLTLLRRWSYKLGWLTSFKVSGPVVVVGNIGIGGNGKTPVVVYLIEQCKQLGLTVGVVSRGYGGNAPHYPYLLNENSTTLEAGDEPILIYSRCQVPVAVGANRVATANLLIEQGCDIIIADDGLQHYKLQRDIELIVVDAKRKFGNGFLLPAGPLREGQWRLKTASFVINNIAQNNTSFNTQSEVSNNIQHETKIHSQKTANVSEINELNMVLKPQFICNVLTSEKISLSVFVQDHVKVNAMAGIGDPERFFNTLRTQKFELNEALSFVDHHHFSEADLSHLSSTLALLMTEKDAVKCKKFAKNNWWYVPVSAEFSEIDTHKLNKKLQAVIASVSK